MTTEVDVANMALDHLEEEPLSDLYEDRTVARWMRRNFGPTRDAMLRSYPWNFATRRSQLHSPARAPFEWSWGYTLPQDVLRIVPLTMDGRADSPPVPFTVEGDTLYTDLGSPLSVRYICRIENPDLWDPMFTQAFAATLAMKAAHYITGKQSMVATLREIAKDLLQQAKDVDAIESGVEYVIAEDWVTGRVRGT